MSTTIEDRFILVLRETGEFYGLWQRLENLTGIAAQRWRKAYTRIQRPTPDMIQALCRLKPEYAFWMATGITDAEFGHKAPESALTFPEWRADRASDESARNYFHASLELLARLSRDAGVDETSAEARLQAFGREQVSGYWLSSALASTAYRVARRPEYDDLKRIREARQSSQHDVPPRKEPRPAVKRDPLLLAHDPKTRHQSRSDVFWVTKPTAKVHDSEKG